MAIGLITLDDNNRIKDVDLTQGTGSGNTFQDLELLLTGTLTSGALIKIFRVLNVGEDEYVGQVVDDNRIKININEVGIGGITITDIAREGILRFELVGGTGSDVKILMPGFGKSFEI